MSERIANITQVMMNKLKDIRAVQQIEFVNNVAVRFTLHGDKFDVRGNYPFLVVSEVVGCCLTNSAISAKIEEQLNA